MPEGVGGDNVEEASERTKARADLPVLRLRGNDRVPSLLGDVGHNQSRRRRKRREGEGVGVVWMMVCGLSELRLEGDKERRGRVKLRRKASTRSIRKDDAKDECRWRQRSRRAKDEHGSPSAEAVAADGL